MFDQQLTMLLEQVRERQISFRRGECVTLLDLHPRQRPHLRGQLIARPHVLLLLFHQHQALLQPFFLRHNRMSFNSLFVPPSRLCNRCRYLKIIVHRQKAS
jgi:hypothetical protein